MSDQEGGQVVNPTPDEVALFNLGGHNAEWLATLTVAKRLGLTVKDARSILKSSKGG